MIKDIIEKNNNYELNQEKIKKLKEIFPNCFSKDGKLDIELLKEELNTDVEFTKESFELNFLGKSYAKMIAGLDTETVIKPDIEHNNLEENKNSGNVYISGDNIDALKHLLKAYEGKIKCIYIDPPYNTGSDGFVYNDSFKFSKDDLIDKLDVSEEEAERILNLTSSSSSSHSAWLTFMYPRLYLARHLLTEDGVIFISIDDNEQSNLKLLCDSIFGEENVLGILPTIMNLKGNNDEYGFSGTHEYTLVYSKNKEISKVYELELDSELTEEWDKDEYGYYKKGANLKSTGVNAPREKRPNLFFPLYIDKENLTCSIYRNNETDIELFPITEGKEMSWRWSKEKFASQYYDIIVTKNSNEFSIYKKQRPTLGDIPTSKPKSILYKPEYSSGNGTNRIKDLFGYKAFNNPKPVNLIYDLLQIGVNQNDIILDFFAGSSTTADAIMQLNVWSKENKNLKYILVQWQEKCDKNSEAYKNGYKTIDEIGQERIKRAAKKIKEETNADIDYGFKHYTLINTSDELLNKLEIFNPELLVNESYDLYKEYGIETILETWKLKDGYEFTTNVEKIDCNGYTAFKCEESLYLIEPNIDIKNIETLLEKYNKDEKFTCNKLVLFGYSFKFNEIEMIKNNIKQVKNFKNIDVKVYTRY